MKSYVWLLVAVFVLNGGAPVFAAGADPLFAGWASVDITPEKPVALVGQLHKRISERVRDPLTATALALETKGSNGETEQAILVSCDIISTKKVIQERLRDLIRSEIPDFDPDKLFMNATHTHTAPGFIDGAYNGLYDVSEDEGVMKASEYADFFLPRVAKAVTQAWKSRKPAGMSWALSHAMVGMNRRAHYFDGTTVMYGKTDKPEFSNIEGYEDHGIELLFFWNADRELIGIVINIACPSQETEGLSEVSADYWHDVREMIHAKFSADVFVLPQCSSAGDQSPHYLFRKRAEEIMRERRGLSSRREIARRITNAVIDGYSTARDAIETKLDFRHKTIRMPLPAYDNPVPTFYLKDPLDSVEFHVLRLGEVAMATNPFELYLDYGIRIKARSPAVLTFLVQLSNQNNGYLPTPKAIEGGGYSAVKFGVGPEGAQILVNKTVETIQAMWD